MEELLEEITSAYPETFLLDFCVIRYGGGDGVQSQIYRTLEKIQYQAG